MLTRILAAWSLMALCVVVHALGVSGALRWMGRHGILGITHWTWLFVRLAGWMILLHMVEIVAWAFLFHWGRAMPDLQSAIYFSATTYTTTGYGDLVLPAGWRLVGSIEALTGILMCGWSTGFFFAAVNRMVGSQSGPHQEAL
jgi:hypothetical protein